MNSLRRITPSDCECRSENAIFHEHGRVALVTGNLLDGYKVASVTTHEDLCRSEPNGWTQLYFQIAYEMEDGTALAGESSYGGAGFFAFRISDRFTWLLHLDNMNNPISVAREGNTVVGRTDSPYPNGSIFRIPIDAPEQFSVTQNKEA